MIRIAIGIALELACSPFVLMQALPQRVIAICSSSDSRKFVGDLLRLPVPKSTIVNTGKDVDYQSYSIGFGEEKNRVYLWGGFGPTWSSGEVPNKLKQSSSTFAETKWIFADPKLGGGVDAKGQLKNGNYWRFFGVSWQTVEYSDVSKEASEYFDKIIDDVCYRKPIWMR